MGYYTRYEISSLSGDDEFNVSRASCLHQFADEFEFCPHCGSRKIKIMDLRDAVADFLGMEIYKNSISYDPFKEDCKWYEHDRDMKAFSLKYPNMIFRLYGRGERDDDIWCTYYKNGKMQKTSAKVTFGDFNESELQ